MEEYHLTVLVPRGLAEADRDAIYQTLDGVRFAARLLRAVREAFRSEPSLSPARVRLSR